MRKFRAVLAALVAALLVAGVLSVERHRRLRCPSASSTRSAPGDNQVSYNAFKLKGTVMEPQARRHRCCPTPTSR